MKHHRSIAAALAGFIVLGLAYAQAPPANAPTAQEIQQRLADAKARLDLTPEQEQRLRPLLEQEGAKLREIQAKYGQTASRPDRRAALGELRAVQQSFRGQAAAILTPEQLAEWDEMRAEARERFRQRRQQ